MLNLNSFAHINVTNELDVSYDTPSGNGIQDVYSQIYTRYKSSIQGYADILELGLALPSKASIKYATYFAGRATIPLNNIMDVTTNIVQPPEFNYDLTVNKDSFVRENKPLLNYGTRQTLLTGKDYSGNNIIYLNFDLSPLSELSEYSINDIVLSIQKETGLGGTLNFYECSSSWYENYIIWNNKPTLNSLLFSIGTTDEQSVVVYNMKDMILQKYENGQTQFSLAITCDDSYVILGSKESNTGAKLVIKYIDPSWRGFVDKMDMYNKAIIRRIDNKDYQGAALIVENIIQNCKANITRPEMFNSKASIINMQNESKANIVKSIYSEGKGFIQGKKEFSGKAFIPRRSMHGEANIYLNTNLNGSVRINPDATTSTLTNKAGIIKNYIESITTILHTRDMIGAAYIKQYQSLDLTSKVSILNSFMQGKVNVNEFISLNGSASIIINDFYNMSSNASILNSFIQSKAHTHNTINMNSSASVVLTNSEDFTSRSGIINQNIYGSMNINITTGLQSKTYINGTENLISNVNIIPFMQMSGMAEIKQFDILDIASMACINVYNDMTGKANINPVGFNGEAYIIQPRQWRPNYEGGLIFEDRVFPRKWI